MSTVFDNSKSLYSLYRAKVVEVDEENMRIKVAVASHLRDPNNTDNCPWAEICTVNFMNNKTFSNMFGLLGEEDTLPLVLPEVDDIVWVTYEGGDMRRPIYVGSRAKNIKEQSPEWWETVLAGLSSLISWFVNKLGIPQMIEAAISSVIAMFSSMFGGGGGFGGGSSGGGGSSRDFGGGDLTDLAIDVIMGGESGGNYAAINWQDGSGSNAGISIGAIQWHNNRARNLLKDIRALLPSDVTTINGHSLSLLDKELEKSWEGGNSNNYKGTAVGSIIEGMLQRDEGRIAQNNLLRVDVSRYIDKGRAAGITDPKALIYYADVANQYGEGSPILGRMASAGNSLESVHSGATSYTSAYSSRRNNVYSQLSNMTISEGSPSGDIGLQSTGLFTGPVDPTVANVVRIAQSKLGQTIYTYGGNSFNSTDCSGFVQLAYREAGVNISRSTMTQEYDGVAVSKGQQQAGDLIIYGTSGSNAHVLLCINGTQAIHNPGTGKPVSIVNIADYEKSTNKAYKTTRRIIQ